MRLNIEPDARTLLNRDNHSVITVESDQECVDNTCSEMVNYPVITFKTPDVSEEWKYEMFSVDGVTVYFDKTLETVPEVTIARESHLIKDKIMLKGLGTPEPIRNIRR
mgnify:CR=1 FL=1